ncbi:MAG TPA: lipoyl synthase [Actinobacteria bacterium]|nr:lipoyl synthase [Actinomycetota bacterium]
MERESTPLKKQIPGTRNQKSVDGSRLTVDRFFPGLSSDIRQTSFDKLGTRDQIPERLPHWLIKHGPQGPNFRWVGEILAGFGLSTVCQSALCPNLGECFSRGTATFMILGTRCTRRCGFCAIEEGEFLLLQEDEPERLALAARELGLRYVVVTSVTRDDLPDGGASQFAATVRAVKNMLPRAWVEVLTPDFRGSIDALTVVLREKPHVFAHNLETVPRLYPLVRPGADYERSLYGLREAKRLNGAVLTKSGLILGLGERRGEIVRVMEDLRGAGCDVLTLGQYLRPSKEQLPVARFLPPEEFAGLEAVARRMGFRAVSAGPFVRSSYRAGELLCGILSKS